MEQLLLTTIKLELFFSLQELEDFETVSDFEVLMKSPHGPSEPEKDEFNNHKDYSQEKPSKLKQR